MSKLIGEPALQSSRSRWLSIHQEKPSTQEWRVWKKANRLWSTPSGKLYVPLGTWLRPHRERRVMLCAYHYKNRLAVRVMDGFVICRQRSASLYRETDHVIRYQDIPSEAVPSTVVHEDDMCWRLVQKCQVIHSNNRLDWSTFSSFIESLDPWEKDLLRNTRLRVDPASRGIGTSTQFLCGKRWIIKVPKARRIWLGSEHIFGRANRHWQRAIEEEQLSDSYRAECSGMLAILRFLIRLAEYTDMVGTWVGRVGTDSQSLLDRVFESNATMVIIHTDMAQHP
jgi:hypothetical protein